MDPFTLVILLVAGGAMVYFLTIRPQRRRQQEQQKMMSQMQPGTRVMLSSGIYASVVSVGEKQAVLELAPGVQVTVLKQVIMQVITPDSPYAEEGSTPAVGGATGTDTVTDPEPAPREPAPTDSESTDFKPYRPESDQGGAEERDLGPDDKPDSDGPDSNTKA
ncbi:preprotein translocase subunit YajC [Enemella evansiae]|uniref:preprotein translocase subunit YajC n=1 Tax=Enemella evansiae TaxID=2016499 RepID=UPI000B96D2A1|nr:preprotein translocase subunit YajC [Enemella evansiae]OYN96108.1 preprotein translocase subunit YajC [Enemella evansiae]